MNKKFKFITIFFFFSLFVLALNIDVKSDELLEIEVKCNGATWCMENCGKEVSILNGTACCKSGVTPRGHVRSSPIIIP